MKKGVKTIQVGEEIPGVTKKAIMFTDPHEGPNVVHTDEFAKKMGLRGGLIGGSTLLSYVLEMLYDQFGQNWLSHGKINVSFISGGAINGDVCITHGVVKSIEQEADGTRVNLDVWMENQMLDGAKIIVGEASCLV